MIINCRVIRVVTMVHSVAVFNDCRLKSLPLASGTYYSLSCDDQSPSQLSHCLPPPALPGPARCPFGLTPAAQEQPSACACKPNQTTGAGEDFGDHDFPSMPLVCFVSHYLLLPLDTMQNHRYLLTER
jgi:hypothetical protein